LEQNIPEVQDQDMLKPRIHDNNKTSIKSYKRWIWITPCQRLRDIIETSGAKYQKARDMSGVAQGAAASLSVLRTGLPTSAVESNDDIGMFPPVLNDVLKIATVRGGDHA
jgi:hypothetical protein